jgi:hypothetical protein
LDDLLKQRWSYKQCEPRDGATEDQTNELGSLVSEKCRQAMAWRKTEAGSVME